MLYYSILQNFNSAPEVYYSAKSNESILHLCDGVANEVYEYTMLQTLHVIVLYQH